MGGAGLEPATSRV